MRRLSQAAGLAPLAAAGVPMGKDKKNQCIVELAAARARQN
jgi:hypothetical protein